MPVDLWVSLPYATFLLICRDGRVVLAPPVARWTIGKDAGKVQGYYLRKGAEVRKI